MQKAGSIFPALFVLIEIGAVGRHLDRRSKGLLDLERLDLDEALRRVC